MFHGRLLAGGNPRGAEGLDTYGAACLAWADLDGSMRMSAVVMVDPKGKDLVGDLRAQLVGGRRADNVNELAEMREAMGLSPENPTLDIAGMAMTGAPPPPPTGNLDDLAALRARLAGDDPK